MASIPSKCISAQFVEKGKPLEFRELALPAPKQDEVLIKLEYSGVCHSDVHLRNSYWDILQSDGTRENGMTLGHEGIGKVVALGSNVTTLKIGDRVVAPWFHSSCLECEFCLGGNETLCQSPMNHGKNAHGTFSQYMIGHASFSRKVPEGLSSAEAGPIACAGVTTYKALKVSGLRPGHWVALAGGAGGLGHIAVQYAKYMGMKVLGIDTEDKLDFMKNTLGYDAVVDARSPNLVEEIVQKTNGGPHGALNLTSFAKCVEDAVLYVRPKGTIVCVGIPNGKMEIDAVLIIAKELTIKGTYVGTRQDVDEALAIAAEGKVRPVVEIRKFADTNAALEDLESGKVKGRLVVDISQL